MLPMQAWWKSASNLDMPLLSIVVLSEQPAFRILHSETTAECEKVLTKKPPREEGMDRYITLCVLCRAI